MGRAGAFAALILAAAAPAARADLFPVQPLAVERDNLGEAYQRALTAQPDQKAVLVARRAALFAFAAAICKGPNIDPGACQGRIFNNQAAAFDIPVRVVGPYRIRPVQSFGRSGAKAYSLNLVEFSRVDGKPDPQLTAFNAALRTRALKLVADRGQPGKLNDINLLVASVGGDLISAHLMFGVIGYAKGEENTVSRTYCLTEFPWLMAERRPLAITDLFGDPRAALAALKSQMKADASLDELADPQRWAFLRAGLKFARPSADCLDEDNPQLQAPMSTVQPLLRKGGPVDLTALVDVTYEQP